MYALTTPHALPAAVDFDGPAENQQLHYWRKHPDLHGWFRALYESKGGANPDFNLAPVALDRGDLDALETAVKTGGLPRTEGFFFGESYGSERAGDLAFIGKAREAIAAGLAVYYLAWW